MSEVVLTNDAVTLIMQSSNKKDEEKLYSKSIPPLS